MSRIEGPLGHPVRPAEADGYSAAARTWRPLVEPGMLVAGIAGDIIGQIKETRQADFLVDRAAGLGLETSDLIALPYERIHVMLADKMTLDIPSSQVDDYATPPSPYTL